MPQKVRPPVGLPPRRLPARPATETPRPPGREAARVREALQATLQARSEVPAVLAAVPSGAFAHCEHETVLEVNNTCNVLLRLDELTLALRSAYPPALHGARAGAGSD
ncbi:unnamed protein product [Prorocentrum cordatum]|uniref:Uncharacterized protein n=1 Tax=Prorocentrum cordatum TaxID=2364126 RepID=A0ABN9TYE9_9DINO|nr:unnamed protein product [Polarella glacialis]